SYFRPDCPISFLKHSTFSIHHNSAVSRSQALDEKRGGWWQPHYVVFYESEEELYYGYIDIRVFVLVLSYEVDNPSLSVTKKQIKIITMTREWNN
ncbi:hypothetical protein BpHYR1_017646, partial [Brachionus plicatilis]